MSEFLGHKLAKKLMKAKTTIEAAYQKRELEKIKKC